MTFDLAALDAADEAVMEVIANGQPTGWRWTFAGPGHPRAVEQQNRIARAALAEGRAKEQAQVNGRKWKAPEKTPDEQRAENVEFVIERLLGWSEVTMGGEPFPFTPENARALLSDRKKPALLAQAVEFLLDDASFTVRSAKS